MDTLTPAAGFIDPALVPEPDVETLREELAHALHIPSATEPAPRAPSPAGRATAEAGEDAGGLATAAERTTGRMTSALDRLRRLLVPWHAGTGAADIDGAASATGRGGAPKVVLTIHVQRRGASADVALPEAWSAEFLHALTTLVEGHGVEWMATRAAQGVARAVTSPPATSAVPDAALNPDAHSEARDAADDEIGTGELAAILGVSEPTARAVLDRGEIPSRRTPGVSGRGHRRVSRAAALAWRRRHDAQIAALRDLVQMAEVDEGDGPSLPSGVRGDPDVEADL